MRLPFSSWKEAFSKLGFRSTRKNRRKAKKARQMQQRNMVVETLEPRQMLTATPIYDFDDLMTIDDNATNLAAEYVLQADLDLNGETFAPLGTSSAPFTGSFDGNGYTIDGLTIDNTGTCIGLFGYTEGAEITDVTLTNVDIDVTYAGGMRVGALVGEAHDTIVSDCSSSSESSNGISITCTGGNNVYVGGLVGLNIFSSEDAPGANGGVWLSDSYSECTVNASSVDYVMAGGLVGYNNGSNANTSNQGADIEYCYATGNVTAESQNYSTSIGGLVGDNRDSNYAYSSSDINYSYSSGLTVDSDGQNTNCSGLVGYSYYGSYTDNYWNTTTSGQTDGVGNYTEGTGDVTGKTSINMANAAYLDNWNFTADGDGPDSGRWIMTDRPHLQVEMPAQDASGVYQIEEAKHVAMMALDLEGDYELVNDIDLSVSSQWNSAYSSYYMGFTPVGDSTSTFTGTLDGNGYSIDGLTIDSGDTYLGLFGYTDDAEIFDVALTNVAIDVTRAGSTFGGALVGYAADTIITPGEIFGIHKA